MRSCWSCGEASPGAPFCGGCGAVQPLRGEGPFELLGLAEGYSLDPVALERRYRDLHRKLHPDRFAQADVKARRYSLERATALNEAYRTLKDPLKRAAHVLTARGVVLSEERGPGAGEAPRPKADPEFLMEVLELREALDEAKAARDLTRVREMANDVLRRRDAAARALAEGLDGGRGAGEPEALAGIYGRLKYFARFLDEVEAIEAEAADAAPLEHS